MQEGNADIGYAMQLCGLCTTIDVTIWWCLWCL